MSSRDRLIHLFQDPGRAGEVMPADVPGLLGELESVRVLLFARLLSGQGAVKDGRDDREAPDRLLTPSAAAVLLGVSVRWLHKHHRQLSFTRRLSRRALRFSELGLRHWIEQRQQGRA